MTELPCLRRLRGHRTLAASLGGALLVAGCTLAPRFERPALPVAADWPDVTPAAARGASEPGGDDTLTVAADIGWRDFFSDQTLQRLIELALANNRDARIAAINVAAARAQYQVQRGDLFPTVNATASEDVAHTPSSVFSTRGGGGAVTPGTGGGAGGDLGGGTGSTATAVGSGGITTRSFSVGLGFTAYELDLFGRIRSLTNERLEQYFGYFETRRSAVISLVSEVANAYLTVLSDEELLRVTQNTLKSQQASYEIVKRSFEGGVETGLAVRQAETSVDQARVNLALYIRQLAQDRHALTFLIGTPIPDDLPLAKGSLDAVKLIDNLPAGMPSEVLANRPDVLSAEHNLAAANANIGAARAAFFPAISLTGNFGTASNELSGLFKSGSRSWSFLPQISLPLFAGGANVANLELAKTQRDLYVAQYERTVQTAFREVADSLVARGTLDEQLTAQQALQEATADAYNLSQLRFQNGIDDYLNVLDSQRSLYSAQQGLVGIKLSRLQNLVTLYKVLGGGWYEATLPPTGNGAPADPDAAPLPGARGATVGAVATKPAS